MSPLRPTTSTPATGNQPAAASVPIPRNAAEAKAMATYFQLQMNAAASSIGADSSGDDDNGDDTDLDLGMGAQMQALYAGSLGLSPATLPQAAQQALTSAGGLGAASATGGDATTSAATAAGGAALLNAPVSAAQGSGGSAGANARIVADAARKAGVDPTLAVAMMLVESGGNARAVGDGGTSFGLFQLHKGGMLTAAGLTPEQAFNPATNAGVALRSLAHESAKGPNRSPGVIAAASQRPADPAGYARKVEASMDRARQLLGG